MKAKSRPYSPVMTARIYQQMNRLAAAGMVYRHPRAVCASAVMTLPTKDIFRIVVDCHDANKQIEQVPAPMIHLERVSELFAGAPVFRKLDLLQGY